MSKTNPEILNLPIFFSQISDYNEEEAAEEAEHDKTPSLSFSATTDSSVRNFDPNFFPS